jgi:hypothetical protein
LGKYQFLIPKPRTQFDKMHTTSMKFLSLAIYFSCLFLVATAQVNQNLTLAERLSKKGGLVLTEENLIPTLRQKGALLVQFYSEG